MSDAGTPVQQMSPEQKRQLLERLLRERARAARSFPLSFAQQRLWVLEQLEPGTSAYHIVVALRLEGRLDVAALRQTLSEVVRRHEALRTHFVAPDGVAAQVIDPPAPVELPVIDLPAASEAEVREAAAREGRRPFDLGKGPLFRPVLFRVGPRDHALLVAVHHLVADGWSMGVLTRELTALYQAFAAGQAPPLPDLPIQYADFAAWQRERLQGPELERLLGYWKDRLAGLTTLELPTDRPRPPVQRFRGAQQSIDLPPDVVAAVKDLGRRYAATPFMTFLAVFQTLLHRYSGQDDITVGSPIAGRPRSETEGLIGLFANTLVLRTDLAGDPTFAELLGRVRTAALGAFGHQELPFEKLVEELNPPRDPSRNPLFQVSFALQNSPRGTVRLPDLSLAPVKGVGESAKFDLSLVVREGQGRRNKGWARVTLEYNVDLFDAATAARMLGHFRSLVTGVLADAGQRLSQLPLLTDAERHQVLVEWNNTAVAYPEGACLHELFEAQAARTPDAVALVFEGERLTYSELNARANRLAHHLRGLGVGPEVLVGVCAERSLEMVVALLGVLKAGGAYVPIDPDYPADRVAFMLEDAQAPVLLTQRRLLGQLPAYPGLVLCLDDAHTFAGESATNPEPLATPDNLAYAIYTSGSTGRPKGVMLAHRGVVNFLGSMRQRPGLTATDTLLAVTTLSFDIAVLELFLPLTTGARVVIAGREDVRDGTQLAGLLEASGATVMQATPAGWRLLLEAGGPRGRVRALCGGEALPRDLADRLLQRCPELWNLYGPTETTVWSTAHPVTSAGRTITVGRPIANTQIYLLDPHLHPVPVGVPGELCIGGVGLARGYRGRPDLTAERFVPDPFAAVPGARMYRTGDLARWLPDGTIEHLRRLDHQVKIRSFRIEPGEIEAVLATCPGVRQAAVVVREDQPGQRRLVAYVVAGPNGAPMTLDLRAFLKGRLPDYMVPAAFVTLAALPLTPNGKVDRRALPAPDGARPDLAEAYVAPETPEECTLARIWADVLRLERVGVHDNFFALGGDSILSLQIVARANQAGLRLKPRQLFQHQTVAELAAAAGAAGGAAAEQGPVTGPVPLTPVQHWFFEHQPPNPSHFNQARLLETREPLDPAALERALAHVLRHHDALRLRFVRGPAGWEQTCSEHADEVPFEYFNLAHVPAEGQPAVVEAHAARLQASLDIESGPLLRLAYFDLGPPRAGRLLWIVHHLAVDGVSWRILLEDLLTAYQQVRRNLPPELPPKTTSFKEWAGRLIEYARSDALASELDYWLDPARADAEPLPVDFPHGVNHQASLETVTCAFEEGETRALLEEVPPVYRTHVHEVLLAALAQTFGRWTGSPALLVDLEGHGREELPGEPDLSRTVGWFTAVYPLLLRADELGGPGDLLQAVKEQVRAVPHGGIGYGVLRYLRGDAALTARLQELPQAQVLFNYQGQADRSVPRAAPYALATESPGLTRDARLARRHLLTINGAVRGGRLRLHWSYSANVYRRDTVEALADRFADALRALIAHCQSPDAGGYTPSDFPLANLGQADLDRLSRLVDPAG